MKVGVSTPCLGSHRVLMAIPGLEAGLGSVQWELVACLGLAWLMVYLIVWKGLHQSGKVGGLMVSLKLVMSICSQYITIV